MEKLIYTKDGTGVLQGKICPFRAPLVLPSASIAGQLTIQNIPCTTACNLLQIEKSFDEDIKDKIIMYCGCEKISLKIDIIHEEDIINKEKEWAKKNNLIL
jgi:hypothetical protein